MRQQTLGLIGGVLLAAGLALNIGAEVLAPRLAPPPAEAAHRFQPAPGMHAGPPGDRGPRR